MATVTDVAKNVAAKIGITQSNAKEVVQATIEAIKELSLEGNVCCAPLGIFKIKHREEREGRNPATGAALTIAAKDVLTFKPTDKSVVYPKKAAPAKKAAAKAAPAKAASVAAKRGRR